MEKTFISWNASNIITINLMVVIFVVALGGLAMFYHQFFGNGGKQSS
jgi:hypothetical protein